MHIIFWLEEGNHMTLKELDQFIWQSFLINTSVRKTLLGSQWWMERVNQYKWDENDDDEKVFNPLWTAVTSFMLHGPCGQHNPSFGCMVDGHCQFGYPKNYQATTEISEDGYPQYH